MPRRLLIAFASSVVLHFVALLWVGHVEPVARTRKTPDPVRFELIIRQRQPPPVPTIPMPPPVPLVRPKVVMPMGEPPKAPVALPPTEVAIPTPPIVPIAPPTPPAEAPKVDLFSKEALMESAKRNGVVLDLPGEKSGLARLPGEAAGEHATTESQRVIERVLGVTADTDARQRVQAGIVDPSYTKMGRAFLDAWDPDRALPETSAELWIKRRAQNAVVSARLWQEAGANYARTGSAVAPGETLERTRDVRPEAALGLGTDGRKQNATFRQYMNGKFNSGRSAHVLVEEDLESVQVSLVQSSGDIDLDRAAVDDVRAALMRMREETPELRQRRKSLWMMRLLILINPPIPVAGVSFDEVIQKPRLELPLDRHLFKHVELEAVYDDDPRLARPDGGPG